MNITMMLPALAVPVAAVLTATPAGADQYDYLTRLDENGIYYSSSTDVIDLGKQLCSIGRTASTTESMGRGMATLLSREGYRGTEREIIVNAAWNGMCPDVIPRAWKMEADEKAASGGSAGGDLA